MPKLINFKEVVAIKTNFVLNASYLSQEEYELLEFRIMYVVENANTCSKN